MKHKLVWLEDRGARCDCGWAYYLPRAQAATMSRKQIEDRLMDLYLNHSRGAK